MILDSTTLCGSADKNALFSKIQSGYQTVLICSQPTRAHRPVPMIQDIPYCYSETFRIFHRQLWLYAVSHAWIDTMKMPYEMTSTRDICNRSHLTTLCFIHYCVFHISGTACCQYMDWYPIELYGARTQCQLWFQRRYAPGLRGTNSRDDLKRLSRLHDTHIP